MTCCRNFSALDNKFLGFALHDQTLAPVSNRVLSHSCSLEHLTATDGRQTGWPWDCACQGIKVCPAS